MRDGGGDAPSCLTLAVDARVTPMRVNALSICAAVLMLAVHASRLAAHPVHTSYGVVTRERGVATLWVRAFSDDFSAAVARFVARPTPRDSSAPAVDVTRYLQARVRIEDANGRAVPLATCGVKRVGAMTWSCASWRDADGLRLVNSVLSDLHADQVNVVQVTGGPTLLFSGVRPRASMLK